MKKVVIGFTSSSMHGKRRKSVVFVDRRPLVRFKAADDFDQSGLMVSVIKTIDRKQLRPEDQCRSSTAGFGLEPYRTHIDEPGTSKNMVVVCMKEDLQTMAQHALIRADQIEGRKLWPPPRTRRNTEEPPMREASPFWGRMTHGARSKLGALASGPPTMIVPPPASERQSGVVLGVRRDTVLTCASYL